MIYRTVRSTPSATGLKTVLRDYSTGTEMLWNTATPGFEAYNAANIADYGIACPEGSPGNYAWAVPATLASSTVGQPYIAVTYTTVTGTLAVGDLATPVNAGGDAFDWDGALPTVKYGGVVMTCSDPSLPALSVHATGSGNHAIDVSSNSDVVYFACVGNSGSALNLQGGGPAITAIGYTALAAIITGGVSVSCNDGTTPAIDIEQGVDGPAIYLSGSDGNNVLTLGGGSSDPCIRATNSSSNYSLQLDNGAWIGGSGTTPALSLIGDTGKTVTITGNSSDDLIHLEQVGNGNAINLESGGTGMTWTTTGDGWDLNSSQTGLKVQGAYGGIMAISNGDGGYGAIDLQSQGVGFRVATYTSNSPVILLNSANNSGDGTSPVLQMISQTGDDAIQLNAGGQTATAGGIGINVVGSTGAVLNGVSGDGLDLTGEVNAMLASNSANGAQLTVADFNGNGAAFASQTGSTVRLGDFGGAGMSLTGSDAAHDLVGTNGDLRVDFANVMFATTHDGVTMENIVQCLLSLAVAPKVDYLDNGNGTATSTFYEQDGTTTKYSVTYNKATKARTASAILH